MIGRPIAAKRFTSHIYDAPSPSSSACGAAFGKYFEVSWSHEPECLACKAIARTRRNAGAVELKLVADQLLRRSQLPIETMAVYRDGSEEDCS